MTIRRTAAFLMAPTWCAIAAMLLHHRNAMARHALEFEAAEAGLYHVIPKFDLRNVPLDEGIREIEKAGDVKITVNWLSLGGAAAASNTPVTLCMEGYSVERVLDMLLATELPDAAYEPRGRTIVLADRKTFARVARVYDIRNLLPARYPPAPPPAPPLGNVIFNNGPAVAPPMTRDDVLALTAIDLGFHISDKRSVQTDSLAIGGRLVAIGSRYDHRQISRRLPLIQPSSKRLKEWIESSATGSVR